jgi:hypothetical protein
MQDEREALGRAPAVPDAARTPHGLSGPRLTPTTPLGPATILALQQAAGNVAIRALLERQPATRPPSLQRQEAAAPASPSGQANPIVDWSAATGGVVLVRDEDDDDERLYVLPAAGLVYVPGAAELARFRESRAHFATDLGALFEVPATGASGTRIFRAGPRLALVLDAGSDPRTAVPGAVYLDQFQAAMSNLRLSGIQRLQAIHVHSDHVGRIAEIVARYLPRAANVIIPKHYVDANADVRRVVAALRATTDARLLQAGFGPAWQPGTNLDPGGPAGDVTYQRVRIGALEVETVALRSALRDVRRQPDLASYLTKVSRPDDQAKVVVLGDLRGRDLETIRSAMERQQPGSWQRFFEGVTTISGFSHHLGRMEERDVAGMMSLLDATMLRAGRLRVVEQTDPGRYSTTRAETTEVAGRLGLTLVYAQLPTPGSAPSGAGATGSGVYVRGPQATIQPGIPSALTAGLQRLEQLNAARATLETWRPWLMEVQPDQRAEIERLLTEIDSSAATLRGALRTATEATLRVRTGGQQVATAGRDYSAAGGPRGAALDTALRAIPATTAAETTIGPQGFEALARMRSLPAKEIPLRVALHAALTRGEYSDKAFRHMLASLDPATRNSLLTGPRGGRSPKLVAFRRVRAEFAFRSSVVPGGDISIPGGWSRGKQRAARGTVGILAALEIWNSIVAPLIEAKQTSDIVYTSQNLVPFVRRLLLWQEANVRPKIVGVTDSTWSGLAFERDYATVVKRLNANELDAVLIEEPGLTDADVLIFGAWLAYNIRNYDEFATFFLDSGQDAITWEVPPGKYWADAKWKVRVGHYETSGANHVEERWYEHPRLTQLMQAYVPRLIANTEELIAQAGTGKPVPAETEARLGHLDPRLPAQPAPRAKLRGGNPTTPVKVQAIGGSAFHPPALLDREVTWSGAPVFYVLERGPTRSEVCGADFNTHASIRRLTSERWTEYMGGVYLNRLERTPTGNELGTIWISNDLLEPVP